MVVFEISIGWKQNEAFSSRNSVQEGGKVNEGRRVALCPLALESWLVGAVGLFLHCASTRARGQSHGLVRTSRASHLNLSRALFDSTREFHCGGMHNILFIVRPLVDYEL